MQSTELKIDVTDAVRFDAAELALTVHVPDPSDLPERPVVVFAVPGGGYSRGYYDMRFEGRSGYSQAEDHARRGIITVAVDHLGVGGSSTQDNAAIQFEDLAAAYNACVSEMLRRLRLGDIAGLPPVRPAAIIGIGQSMGGCVSILTQARHGTFDGIAVLGYSAIHTTLPQPDADQVTANREAFSKVTRGGTGITPEQTLQANYLYPFHFEDVPADIIAADMEGGYPMRQNPPPFGSATMPHCTIQMMLPGVVKAEAAAVDVPVFVGNGERDVCPDPAAETGAYEASPAVTNVVIPAMAHMHNFAGTRAHLWDRLGEWYDSILARS